MNRCDTPRALAFSAALAVATAAPFTARAAGEADPKVESFVVSGSKIQRVRATVAVNAPVERVRTVVFDFPRYPEFLSNYSKASLLGSTAKGGGVVQLELKELGGVIRFWMRLEVSPVSAPAGVEAYSGRLLAGNVKAFEPRWEFEPLDAKRTRFTVESFMDPDLALVPSSAINDGARKGIREAILALKARAEGKPTTR